MENKRATFLLMQKLCKQFWVVKLDFRGILKLFGIFLKCPSFSSFFLFLLLAFSFPKGARTLLPSPAQPTGPSQPSQPAWTAPPRQFVGFFPHLTSRARLSASQSPLPFAFFPSGVRG